MTKIYIVRHGKTDFNEQGRYLGRADLSINSGGKQQAKELAKNIKNLNIDIVISSPLKRAMETAKIIKPYNLEIIADSAFIERSVGVYESLTKDEIKEKYPDLYEKNITRKFNESYPTENLVISLSEITQSYLEQIKYE